MTILHRLFNRIFADRPASRGQKRRLRPDRRNRLRVESLEDRRLLAGLTGAIFTTEGICDGTNVNLFDTKDDVHLNGGPNHAGAAGLDDGEYYVQVTEPDGDVLGTSIGSGDDTPVEVVGGEFSICYQLSAILIKSSDQSPGYDDTTNPGGEYKVWVATTSDFSGGTRKTDNFKVELGDPDPGLSLITIEGRKFEDLNGNGVDDNDPGLQDWHITVTIDGIPHDVTTDTSGDYSFSMLVDTGALENGLSYSVAEVQQDGFTETFPSDGFTYTGEFDPANPNVTDLDFGNFENIDICGVKFYDADTDGTRDLNEPGINGWNFGLDSDGDTIVDVTATTAGETAETGGTFCFTNLGPGTYTVYELDGLSGKWIPTTSTTAGPFVASSGADETTHDFGNVKLGAGGGLTLGYWSNKNGQKTMNDGPGGMAGALAMLSNLNLRNADGTNFNPASYTQFRTWILNATATNMSNMFSAQLAAMSLNVYEGKVSGSSLIYAPGTTSANPAGFATVSAVMAGANTELGLHGLVLAGSPYRDYQESRKNALDNANNNLNFLIGLSAWHDDNFNGVIDAGEI